MSGYKQAIFDLDPKLFLSFDGDTFEPSTGRLSPAVVPQKIIDDSGYDNHADLIVDHADYPTYRLGLPSLIDLEPTGFGFSTGTPSPNVLSPEYFGKSYLVVPHSSDFSFPIRGSYSLIFNFRKEENETLFRMWRVAPQINTSPFSRPYIRKGTVIEIDTIDRWTQGGVTLSFKYLTGSTRGTTQTFTYHMDYNQMRESNHFAVSWDVKVGSSALFTATMTIYHNARIIHQATYDYFDTFPVTNVSSAWEILGDASVPGYNYEDRQVVMTSIDQFAVIARGISHDEVCTLYKKSRSYIDMVLHQGASNLWAFNDDSIPHITTLKDLSTSYSRRDGTYYGISEGLVFRRMGGPDRLPGSFSTQFAQGAVASISADSYSSAPFNPNDDFTIDGWFRTSQIPRGIIISSTTAARPYTGWTLTLGVADGLDKPGRVQLSLSEDLIVNSLQFGDSPGVQLSYNDGLWHYFVIRRRSGIVDFFLDARLQGSISTGNLTIGANAGGFSFMGQHPGDLWVAGNIALVSTHTVALSDANIRARNAYGVSWHIQGNTTLEGIPYEADLRTYNHKTGELIHETTSSATDGHYRVRLYDNSLVSITGFKKGQSNIRMRTFGPLEPAIFDDDPTLP